MTADDPEALRRNLYRPGAGDRDVAAYLAVRPVEEEAPAYPVAASAHPARRPRRLVVGGLVAAVVLVGAVLIGVRDAGSPAARVAPAGAQHVLPTAAATPLPSAIVDRTTRLAFIRNLQAGRDAGVGAWLDSRFADSADGIRVVERHGAGDAVVILPTRRPTGSGAMGVLLVLEVDGEAGWAASRLVIDDDRTVHLRTVGDGEGSVRAGVPAFGRVDYTRATRPTRIAVRAPDGVAWGLAVVTTP